MIADRFTKSEIRTSVLEAVAAGVRWVQLRDHDVGEEAFEVAARELVEDIYRIAPETRISINGRPEIANALKLPYHAGRGRLNDDDGNRLTGFSVHGPEEAQKAIAQGADYLIYSPIFPTGSKPGHPGAGIEALKTLCQQFPNTPIYALGGITPNRVPACIEAGAPGIAVLSGILQAERIKDKVQSYLTNLKPET